MANHTKDERLNLAKLMAERIIKHANHCKFDEYETEEIKHYEVDQLVSLAQMFLSDERQEKDYSDLARNVC